LSKRQQHMTWGLIIGTAIVCLLFLGKYYSSTMASTLLGPETVGAIHNRLLETTMGDEVPSVPAPPPADPRPLVVKLPILMYHEMGTGPNSLYLPEANFRAQMAFLHDSGFQAVTMAQAQEMLAQNIIPAKTVVITFDDGYVSFYTKAWPILQEFGFPATVYVCPGYADSNPNYLNWQQIITLQENGIEIGSHTMYHPSLISCPPDRLTREIAGSKEALEAKLGVPVKSFCYPSGQCNQQVAQLVQSAGYTSAVTVVPRGASHSDNGYLLPRIRVPGWASLNVFAKNLNL